MKASFNELEGAIKQKNGVLSLEHTFFGAFTDMPLKNIYDVWEIPPFGRLGQPGYNGLTSKRVDCVLVSHELSTGIGCATNHQIRYQNHIKPFINQMISSGASYQVIPQYGYVVFFTKHLNKNCQIFKGDV